MATTLGDICKVDWGNTAITKNLMLKMANFLPYQLRAVTENLTTMNTKQMFVFCQR